MVACETTSKMEPVANSMNRAKSGREEREPPSAMFEEMEKAALRIWFVSPKRSSSGTFGSLNKQNLQNQSLFAKHPVFRS